MWSSTGLWTVVTLRELPLIASREFARFLDHPLPLGASPSSSVRPKWDPPTSHPRCVTHFKKYIFAQFLVFCRQNFRCAATLKKFITPNWTYSAFSAWAANKIYWLLTGCDEMESNLLMSHQRKLSLCGQQWPLERTKRIESNGIVCDFFSSFIFEIFWAGNDVVWLYDAIVFCFDCKNLSLARITTTSFVWKKM
jgi:hypothetical protein